MNPSIQSIAPSADRIPQTLGSSSADTVSEPQFSWMSDEVSLDEVIESVGPFWDEADQIAQAFSGFIEVRAPLSTDNPQQDDEGTVVTQLTRVYGLFNQESRPEAWFVRVGVEVYLGDQEDWQDDEAAGLESWPVPRWPLDAVFEDGSGQTVLLRAVALKQKHIVQGLLARNANPNLQDIEGRTALHLIAEDNWHQFMLRGLLTAGARSDIADNQGRTPLHVAIDADNWDGALALVAAGASVKGLEAHATTLWQCAVEEGNTAVQEQLSALLTSKRLGLVLEPTSENSAKRARL